MNDTTRFRRPWFKRHLHLSTRPYFMEKSREAGEDDLEQLVNSEKKEGCWLFVDDTLRWYNLCEGFFERQDPWDGVGVGVRCFVPDVNDISSVTHYHIHPKKREEENLRKICKYHQASEDNYKKAIAIGAAIPSITDIKNYFAFLQINNSGSVDFRIASSHGIFRIKFCYSYCPEIVDKYEKATASKTRAETAVMSSSTKSAIAMMVGRISQEMSGIANVDMQYR